MELLKFFTSLCVLVSVTSASATYQLLNQSCINADCSALRITVNHPPVNLFDAKLVTEVNTFLNSLQSRNDTKVVVFFSGISDFFLGHFDLNLLSDAPPAGVNATAVTALYNQNLDLLLSTPVIFIGEANGRTWGAGNENFVRYDMRFAGPDAVFGAPEAAGGLIHQGGLQQLVQLIGPGLAMEYLLSSAQVNATEAARSGWVNSVFSTPQALRDHVDTLAKRIGLFHIEVIRAHKASIAQQAPSPQYHENDLRSFNDLLALPFAQPDLHKILNASNNQSKPFELNVNDNIVKALY